MKILSNLEDASKIVETTDKQFITTTQKESLANIRVIKFKQGTADFTTLELAEGEIGFLYV